MKSDFFTDYSLKKESIKNKDMERAPSIKVSIDNITTAKAFVILVKNVIFAHTNVADDETARGAYLLNSEDMLEFMHRSDGNNAYILDTALGKCTKNFMACALLYLYSGRSKATYTSIDTLSSSVFNSIKEAAQCSNDLFQEYKKFLYEVIDGLIIFDDRIEYDGKLQKPY